MKHLTIVACIMLCALSLKAQDTYNINGQSYELKTEVNGTINLLWNIIDGQYRYFIQKGNVIEELVNTKDDAGKYKQEYLETLKTLTSDSNVDTRDVKLILYNLKNFINNYNASVDSNYVYDTKKIAVKTRLGFFGGITNSPFVSNPDNELSPVIGGELELYDDNKAKRHAAFLRLRRTFENDKLKYSATELALGYRFRFLLKEKFNIYANVKLATFNNSKSMRLFVDDATDEITIKEVSGSSFDAPVIFGLGADIKLGENGFLTLSYGELFALFLDNDGNFSTDFSLGYKFNL